jgi:hypothetical protein
LVVVLPWLWRGVVCVVSVVSHRVQLESVEKGLVAGEGACDAGDTWWVLVWESGSGGSMWAELLEAPSCALALVPFPPVGR